MNFGWNFLVAVRQLIPRAHYAQPGQKKAKVGVKVAIKQQFRKRFKEANAAQSSSSAPATTQREALTEALFTNNNEQTPLKDAETLEQRAIISKAWSRMQMLRQHSQSSWERTFLQSKLRAMDELQAISPELANLAKIVDYSIPPAHRRIPTETPPNPSKFPFRMNSQIAKAPIEN
jgi:hypothetical protein